jgi:hypothetical protein
MVCAAVPQPVLSQQAHQTGADNARVRPELTAR